MIALRSSEGFRRWLPLLVLLGVLALTFIALLVRGLDLGFSGDLLDYAFHYDRFGTFGGMQWLVTQHLHRHLLAGLFSAPIAYLFPFTGSSMAWYGYAFLVHFANAVMVYVLVTTILRGQRRWLALAAALVFTFYALQAETQLRFPTSGHRNSALFLALLSLWFYLQYVRRRRHNRWWRELALLTYVVALMTYEQTVLFFLLHPLIAYFEDRHNQALDRPIPWLIRVALDSLWFPLVVAGYLFLLRVLFPPGDDLSLSSHRLLSQIGGGLGMIFSPTRYASLITPALVGGALIVTFALIIVTSALIFGAASTEPEPRASDDSLNLIYLTFFGAAIIVAIILGAAPTSWIIPDNPRIIYPAGIGVAMLLVGGLSLLLMRVPSAVVRRAIIALIVAVTVGTGATRLFQQRDVVAHENDVRQHVLDAIHGAVPALKGEMPPYFVIVTDVDPTDLYLHAQDIVFPLLFDHLYRTDGIMADAIYYGLDRRNAPLSAAGQKAYNGQFISAGPDGLYSPTSPHLPIDPKRLVIVRYDSTTDRATVLDQLPADVIERGNVVAFVPFDWKTNRDLIVMPTPSP